MNRSILIVICDFLLVSLLAFSTVDINKVSDDESARNVGLEMATNQVDSGGKDLAAVMRLALDEERKNRDQLLGELARTRQTAEEKQTMLSQRETELARTRQTAEQQQATLGERERELAQTRQNAELQQALLSEREKQIKAFEQKVQGFQQEVQAREQQAQQLKQDQARLQELQTRLLQEQSSLQQQHAAAQTNLQGLNQQLQASSAEAQTSRDKLAATEAELRRQTEQAAALQQKLAQLAQSNQVVLEEKQRLAGQLQVAEVERRHASEQAVRMQEQVLVERQEKAKLADGVKALANQSGDLAREVREFRPLAPNTIFNEFTTNRIRAAFHAFRPTFLSIDANRRSETESILVSDGTNTFAMCHVQETPLAFWNPGVDWESLNGSLGAGAVKVPIQTLSFHLTDPRVVLIPLSASETKVLGRKVYRATPEPYKFQDAVLIGAREGYYGECRFQIDLSTPQYVKLDNNFLKGVFGKFNPSSGDLVFSKGGELLGIMVNNTYCMMLKDFNTAATLRFGQDVRVQRTGHTLTELYAMVASLPARLQ